MASFQLTQPSDLVINQRSMIYGHQGDELSGTQLLQHKNNKQACHWLCIAIMMWIYHIIWTKHAWWMGNIKGPSGVPSYPLGFMQGFWTRRQFLTASTQRETTNIHTHIDNYSRFRVANHLIVASPLTVKGKQNTQRGATQTGSVGKICKTISVSIQLYLYGTIL